jgi:hypothetical protein
MVEWPQASGQTEGEGGKGPLEQGGKWLNYLQNYNLTCKLQKWKSLIDPLLKNPLNQISILENIELQIGNNVINHKLGRKMQGWIVLDVNAATVIYRSAPLNNLTLTLNSSAKATINLGVF